MIEVRGVLAEWVASLPGSSIKTIYEKDSVVLSEAMVEVIGSAAEIEGLPYLRMASGAGHDAQSFAPFVPTGMIFIPCRGGMSHCPDEWADPQAVYDGCRLLVRTVLELARQDLRGFEAEDG
jgi:N-carbamoyl-L-amino-acid hydrolase